MKYLKEYYNYDDKVAEICTRYGINNWSIRDGLVDVDGDVNLVGFNLTKLPLKFGKVTGWFDCGANRLITLEGSPTEVGSDFICVTNLLETLEGCPKKIGGNLTCIGNKIKTLEYFPIPEEDILISSNPLPKEIWDNIKHLKKIIEWQDEYDIWRDGKLYLPRFRDLMIDIKEGL